MSIAFSGNTACRLSLIALAIAIGSPASAQELTFGYIPGSMTYPYNVATAAGFEEAAKEAGVATVGRTLFMTTYMGSVDDIAAKRRKSAVFTMDVDIRGPVRA